MARGLRLARVCHSVSASGKWEILGLDVGDSEEGTRQPAELPRRDMSISTIGPGHANARSGNDCGESQRAVRRRRLLRATRRGPLDLNCLPPTEDSYMVLAL